MSLKKKTGYRWTRLRLTDMKNNIPEFIDRINNPDKYPFITNEDGSISTHRMAAEVDENGNWFVFPTIVLMPDGTLKEFEDNAEALDYNLSIGNFLPMKNKNEAIKYAEGGYKKGTTLETFNPFQIEDILSNPLMQDSTK
jgi:hypothetical protein